MVVPGRRRLLQLHGYQQDVDVERSHLVSEHQHLDPVLLRQCNDSHPHLALHLCLASQFSNGTVHFIPEDAACPVADTPHYDDPSHSLKGSMLMMVSSKAARCMMESSVEDVNTAVTSTSQLDLMLRSVLFGNGTSKSSNGTGSNGLSRRGIIALSILDGLLGLLALFTLLFCFRYRIKVLFRREKKSENQARKQDGDDMDFLDIIRNSYSRQYERYRLYRQSKDTAVTTVIGSLGGSREETHPAVCAPTGGSRPGGLEAEVLLVFGRIPSSPKSNELGFDEVGFGSAFLPLLKTHAPVARSKLIINAAIISNSELNVDIQQLPFSDSTV